MNGRGVRREDRGSKREKGRRRRRVDISPRNGLEEDG